MVNLTKFQFLNLQQQAENIESPSSQLAKNQLLTSTKKEVLPKGSILLRTQNSRPNYKNFKGKIDSNGMRFFSKRSREMLTSPTQIALRHKQQQQKLDGAN